MNPFAPQNLFSLSDFAHVGLFEDLSYPWEALANLREYLSSLPLGSIKSPIPNGVSLIDQDLISIEEGVVIEPGVYIKGPCHLSTGTVIRHGAYLRGDTLTGKDCVIGHATEVKHTIFLNGAKAAHFAYVGDSVLGNGVNLGAGTKCANLRLDGGEVFLSCEGEQIRTGMRKLGAIFGDQAQTGCNAVTNPGTIFAPGAICFPCKSVGGYVRAKEVENPVT